MPIPTAAALHGVHLSMTTHSDPAAIVHAPHSARPCRDARTVGVYHPAVESPAPLGLIGTHTARKAASRPHFIPVFAWCGDPGNSGPSRLRSTLLCLLGSCSRSFPVRLRVRPKWTLWGELMSNGAGLPKKSGQTVAAGKCKIGSGRTDLSAAPIGLEIRAVLAEPSIIAGGPRHRALRPSQGRC